VTTPVVLLHGQPGNAAVWELVRAALPADLPVVVPDRPGYGVNRAPATNFGGNVGALRRVMDAAGYNRAVVVAHSWATGPALLAAVRHPDRVAGLVLVSTLGPHCLNRTDVLLGVPGLGDLLTYGAFTLGGPAIRHWVRRIARRSFDDVGSARLEHRMAANRARRVWRSFQTEQRALLHQLPEVDAALPYVRVPTVLLHGDRDEEIPLRTAQHVAATIPGASLTVLPGVGHNVPLEAPEAIGAAIRDVVSRR
jgi:pimeloyl-ACP methyl ester carboxylesterase